MSTPLMPKATAVWLVDNTALTFEQIANFCSLHLLEIQGIADGEVAKGIKGIDPIIHKQLTSEEIKKCELNANLKLQLSKNAERANKERGKQKKAKYIPMARRQDKPSAIAWLLKKCPELSEQQITKLIGTTKTSISSIKERSHWNIHNILPRDPVLLGLCSQKDLDNIYAIAKHSVELAKKSVKASEEQKIVEKVKSFES